MKRIVIFGLLLIIYSCSNDDNQPLVTTAPTVVLNEITSITETSATIEAEVTDDGNLEVTSRGVVWSLEPNPTLEDSESSSGTGSGVFESNMMGLTEGTTYYVRAYATNSEGTSYSTEQSFGTSLIFYGDVFLDTQQDVEEFGSIGYTGIEGDFQIGNFWVGYDRPNDLTPLISLTNVSGQLAITSTHLNSFEGLNNLEFINGNLVIYGNSVLEDISSLANIESLNDLHLHAPNLTSLSGLQNISNIEGNFGLYNLNISSLSEMENLESIGGDINIEDCNSLLNLDELTNITNSSINNVRIESCNSLTNLNGLSNVLSIGSLEIVDCDLLIDLSGLSNVSSIGSLEIDDCNSLISLNGITNDISLNSIKLGNNALLEDISSISMNEVVDWISLGGNPNLISLEGLENVTSCLFFGIVDMNITSLEVFASLESIEGNLTIRDCNSLINLNDLSNLSYISELYINGNDALTDLEGLSNATGPIFEFYVQGNNNLQSLNGVQNLMYLSTEINITNNQILTDFCAIEDPILQNNHDGYTIEDNAYNPTLQDFLDGNCSQ